MNLIALDLIYYTVRVTPDIQQNYHSFILCMSTTQLLLLACYTGHETFHLFYRHGEWFLGVGKVVFLTFFVHWYTVMYLYKHMFTWLCMGLDVSTGWLFFLHSERLKCFFYTPGKSHYVLRFPHRTSL